MANPANSTAYKGPNGQMWVDVTEAKTLGIADSGYLQNIIYDNAVITLPATATQGIWYIRNGGVSDTDATVKLSISPNASDKVQGGPDGSAVDDKDIINTKATSLVGDFAVIQNTGETNGPLVVAFGGIWTREA